MPCDWVKTGSQFDQQKMFWFKNKELQDVHEQMCSHSKVSDGSV